MSTDELKGAVSGKKSAKPQNINELSQFLAGRMGQIKSVIANKLTPEKMARIALNELRRNGYLAKIPIQNKNYLKSRNYRRNYLRHSVPSLRADLLQDWSEKWFDIVHLPANPWQVMRWSKIVSWGEYTNFQNIPTIKQKIFKHFRNLILQEMKPACIDFRIKPAMFSTLNFRNRFFL